jgi:hypothetical protein
MMPIKDATTPRNLRTVNVSTPMKAPRTRVQTPRIIVSYHASQIRNIGRLLPLVEVKMVVLPTVVNCRHPMAK